VSGPHQWLLVSEAAAMLGVHPHTLTRGLPGLPYMRVGRRGDRRYRLADVERYIASRMVRP
jgi:hypothetical protein